jgi:DNA-binding transcriptional LysR family regulator
MAVAECLHFRKAADRLFITQPGLSRQIKQLEGELGVSLFKRSTKSVVLSEEGEILREKLSVWIRDMEDFNLGLKDRGRSIGGTIRLGYVGGAMHSHLPDEIAKFLKKHSVVKFHLTELDNATQIAQLLSRHIDVAFVRQNQVPKELHILPFKKETFSLVLPKSHTINQKNFKSLSQVKNEEFIFFNREYSPSYYERIMSIFEDCGFSPMINHRSVHATTIFRLVENGFGLSIVPTSLKTGYDMNIKFIELKNIQQQAVLFMAWRKDTSSVAVKKFIEHIS